jgi:hypothetical protein
MMRYNQLFKMARDDRNTYPEVFQQWRVEKMAVDGEAKKVGRHMKPDADVEVESELFDRMGIVKDRRAEDMSDSDEDHSTVYGEEENGTVYGV